MPPVRYRDRGNVRGRLDLYLLDVILGKRGQRNLQFKMQPFFGKYQKQFDDIFGVDWPIIGVMDMDKRFLYSLTNFVR